ncbi:MAG: hypothetical protein JWO76_1803 [Nocardioides sp.]|nr:hypothetical protein [Nocardioides sp.]
MNHQRLSTTLVTLLLVGVAALVGACGAPVETGTVLAARATAEIRGSKSFVQLPQGRLTFETSPIGELPRGSVLEGAASDTGDVRFVGVRWTYTPGAGVPTMLSGFLMADRVPSEVALIVDGTAHTLGQAYSVPGGTTNGTSFYVAVADSTKESGLAIEVTMAGAVQTVSVDGSRRDAGQAAALYDLPHQSTDSRCAARLEPARLSGSATCSVSSVLLPWVSAEGWAPDGHTWAIVDVTTELDEIRSGGGSCRVVGQDDASTLDGASSDTVLAEDSRNTGTSLRTQLAFDAPENAPMSFDLERTVTCRRTDGPDPLGAGTAAIAAETVLR